MDLNRSNRRRNLEVRISDLLDRIPLINSKNTIVRMIGFIGIVLVFSAITDLHGDDNSISASGTTIADIPD